MKTTNQQLFASLSFLVFFFMTFSVSAQLKMGIFLEDKICYLTNEQVGVETERIPTISINFGVDANYFFESGFYLAAGLGYELTGFKSERIRPTDNIRFSDKFSRQSIAIPVEMGYQFYVAKEVISTGFVCRPRITFVDKGTTQAIENGRNLEFPLLEYTRESSAPFSLQYYIGMQRELFSKSIVMIQIFVEYDPNQFLVANKLLYSSTIQFGLRGKYIL